MLIATGRTCITGTSMATSRVSGCGSAQTRMDLPFTTEQFFAVFARYNESVWPMQLVLSAAAALGFVLVFSTAEWASRASAALLALLWLWMAVAYHFAFFSVINPAAWLFGAAFLLGGLAFGWLGVAKAKLRFEPAGGARGIAGAALIVFALVLYPAIGYVLGHRYPSVATFGLPCPTTIYTLGLLLFAARPLPRWVLVVPLLWTGVGSLAAFQLAVVEDLALLAAGIVTVGVMWLWPAPTRPIRIEAGH